MSLLMWSQGTDGFAILTDTYATTPDGDPRVYQSKVWPLPHLNMVIGGTGLGALMEAWYSRIQTTMLVRDIANLDAHTPGMLRELWAEITDRYSKQFGSAAGAATCTIYHFGFTEAGDVVQYTYRSATNFTSEAHAEPYFAVKPQPDGVLEHVPESPDEMVELAKLLRGQEDAKPKQERVHIGGDLIVTFIGPGMVHSERLHRFDDFDDMWNAMTEQITEGPREPTI